MLEIINAKNNTTPNTQTDSLAVAHFFYNVAIKSVHDLCQKSSEINGNDDNIGKKLLLWPLIGLLRKFCQISSVVSEKELVKDNCKFSHFLFSFYICPFCIEEIYDTTKQ